jgi:hypothetical protein
MASDEIGIALAAVGAMVMAPIAESPRVAKVTFRIELSIILKLPYIGVDLNAG